MTDYNLIDSSIWVSYLINGEHKDLIETEKKLLLSTISIIEIIKKLSKLKFPKKEIIQKIGYIKKQSILINLDEKIAQIASQLVVENNLPVADSVVYASAIANNATLFTLDNDFRNLSNVKIL